MAISNDYRHIIDLLGAPKQALTTRDTAPNRLRTTLEELKVDIIYTRGLIIWPSTNVKNPLWFLKLQGYS